MYSKLTPNQGNFMASVQGYFIFFCVADRLNKQKQNNKLNRPRNRHCLQNNENTFFTERHVRSFSRRRRVRSVKSQNIHRNTTSFHFGKQIIFLNFRKLRLLSNQWKYHKWVCKMNADILHQDIQTLLEFFAKNCYRASDSKSSESFFVSIVQDCEIIHLMSEARSSTVIKESSETLEKATWARQEFRVQIEIFSLKDLRI